MPRNVSLGLYRAFPLSHCCEVGIPFPSPSPLYVSTRRSTRESIRVALNIRDVFLEMAPLDQLAHSIVVVVLAVLVNTSL